jgi:hypothetical protein
MARGNWGDAFQELEDSEYKYEIFTKTSNTVDPISGNDWNINGVFNYEDMKKFVSDKQDVYETRYAPKNVGNDVLHVLKSGNIKEKYFHIKIKRGEPL